MVWQNILLKIVPLSLGSALLFTFHFICLLLFFDRGLTLKWSKLGNTPQKKEKKEKWNTQSQIYQSFKFRESLSPSIFSLWLHKLVLGASQAHLHKKSSHLKTYNRVCSTETSISILTPPISLHAPFWWMRIERAHWASEHSFGSKARSNFPILATRDMQFGQELALVMQTTHAQRWQYPDVSTRVCFLPLKCTQVLQKSLSLSIKHACFKRYHHDLLRHLVAFSKFEWFISSDHKIKNFSTHFIHKL